MLGALGIPVCRNTKDRSPPLRVRPSYPKPFKFYVDTFSPCTSYDPSKGVGQDIGFGFRTPEKAAHANHRGAKYTDSRLAAGQRVQAWSFHSVFSAVRAAVEIFSPQTSSAITWKGLTTGMAVRASEPAVQHKNHADKVVT